ncbi:MAG: hypothetical protein DRP80_07625, partial [Candidatus Omnitrophota bacterium]
MKEERRTYLITSAEVVKKYKISYQTLNYYTNLGLLVSKGRIGNKRLYDEKKLKKRLKKIQKLKIYPQILNTHPKIVLIDNIYSLCYKYYRNYRNY